MHQTTISLVCAAFCAFTPFARSQEGMGPPPPAAELKKLEPLIGNWSGKGVFNQPGGGPANWTATGGYEWSHGGFWVREDYTIHFEGMDAPMAIRAYLGWDAENQRYVNVHIDNSGEIGLDELHLQPDGTMLMLVTREVEGMAYCERVNSKVDGDTRTMKIDFLMPMGPSMLIVDGTFSRVDKDAPSALACEGFGPSPHEAMGKFGRGSGVYDVKGSMVVLPGAPPMDIFGTDTFAMIFGGAVMHGHTDGGSRMMPDKYEADVFWGYNKKRGCYTSVFVSNMGEIGEMDMRFSADGKQLISTSATTMQGMPLVQRFVLDLDDNGNYSKGVGHAMFGASPPMESFKATYTKKK